MPRKRTSTGRSRGRPPGSKLRPGDVALCDLIATLIVNRLVKGPRPDWQAALIVAPRAGGHGTVNSKAKRLHTNFRANRAAFMRRARTPRAGIEQCLAVNGWPLLDRLRVLAEQADRRDPFARAREAAAGLMKTPPNATMAELATGGLCTRDQIIREARDLQAWATQESWRWRRLLDGDELN